ncbi:hypothetical protein ACFU7D_24250 [Nocardioides sp. NPDC057577]|uniref:hypothetical protein n=1 Tax=Nocardioides sp. NPDC057577 TaxID=3346171 RepID=UPI003670D7FE
MNPDDLTDLSVINYGDHQWDQVELNIGAIDSPSSAVLAVEFHGWLDPDDLDEHHPLRFDETVRMGVTVIVARRFDAAANQWYQFPRCVLIGEMDPLRVWNYVVDDRGEPEVVSLEAGVMAVLAYEDAVRFEDLKEGPEFLAILDDLLRGSRPGGQQVAARMVERIGVINGQDNSCKVLVQRNNNGEISAAFINLEPVEEWFHHQ